VHKSALRSIAAAAVAVSVSIGAAFAQDADPAALMAEQQPVTVGDLTITQAWARATPPGAVTAAGYLTITNDGAVQDRLLTVLTDFAETGQLHETVADSGNMVMRPLTDGIVIPAGESVVLQPGGYHLMFTGLQADGLVQGSVIKVTLVFAVAGAVEIDLVVYPIGSTGPADAGDAGAGGAGSMGFMGM
jgi:copper(I)-binding protein